MAGRPRSERRPFIFRDLANLKLEIWEIAARNGVSPRLVHLIARENELDMPLRAQIVRTWRKLSEMEKILRRQKTEFLSKFPQDIRDQTYK